MQYFAKQRKIYPRATDGRFRRLKWAVMAALLGLYYGAPWLRWNRGEHMPDQAILIDMPGRRAYFFGIEIWPQEVYYLTGLLILAAVGLFFVTSLLGRVWCGYACPQTVWTDLFIWVERKIQGDHNARKRLDEAPWTPGKIGKKTATHLAWIVIGVLTGGAWVFYFNDAPTLMDQIIHFSVPWSVGGWILALTASTYLMAGFAREQVCIYMCPYARFQSAMFDKNTLVIEYDRPRGEPRGKHKSGESWEGRGHCIDCDTCVAVCPMGIDIRDGLQMECIACGLCVDACDNVMDKIGLPHGLIHYSTESKKPFRLLQPRTFWYAGLLSAVGGVMLYALLTRSPLDLNVIHDRNPLYVQLSSGDIRNGYTLHVLNKSHEDRTYGVRVEGLADARVRIEQNQEIAPDNLRVFADSMGVFRAFVSAPKAGERHDIVFVVEDRDSRTLARRDSIFAGKER